MMHPGSIFEYVDQSQIEPIPVAEAAIQPLFMAAFTSDKGPEDYKVVEGQDFFKLYGDNISFAKHGQPLLQAANIINAGGRLFVKRVVDPSSTLANLAIFATLSKATQQKLNAAGSPLYTDADGVETTEAESQKKDASGNLVYLENGAETTTPTDMTTATPVMVDNTPVEIEVVSVKYSAKNVDNVKTIDDVESYILDSATDPADDGTGEYPLFIVADIGRGLSNKYFQITPDYTSSKAASYTQYMFKVIENNATMENVQFAFNPDIVDNGGSVSMKTRLDANAVQVKVKQFEDKTRDYMKALSKLMGYNDGSEIADEVAEMDILFGKTRKGTTISNISIDGSGTNLSHIYGLRLEGGTDGAADSVFAAGNFDSLFESTIYAEEMAKVFNGGFGTEIYDMDNYKIDAIVDANYPAPVKRAIEDFVSFREDCFYFRDLGLGLKSLEAIVEANSVGAKDKFAATYCTTYDIIDPYSKKQINVTMMYTLSRLLVDHFNNGRNRPIAGQLYNMILTDAIEGTVNFIPTITPSVNQKEILGENKINYASYFDGLLVIETLYTSQDKDSQFSFINNILAIQEVIKAVRTRCPKIRYSFMDGDDLNKYKEDVQSVIDRYTTNFMELTFEYISDSVYISNKIFYAAIKVKFRNFVQTEYFKVIALPS